MVTINSLCGYCCEDCWIFKEWKNAKPHTSSFVLVTLVVQMSQTGSCNRSHIPYARAVMSCLCERVMLNTQCFIVQAQTHCETTQTLTHPLHAGWPHSQHILFVFPSLFCHPVLFNPAIAISALGLSRYHKMSYDTIPAEVSRYQVVSRYHPCSVVSLKLNSTKWINK